MKDITLGHAELEIMKVIWKTDGKATSVSIGKEVEDKGWKKTTIGTFLTRLVEKGALEAEKHGKIYYYTPLISEDEYKQSRTRELIHSLFNGSIKELALSLFNGDELSQNDILELRALINDKESK